VLAFTVITVSAITLLLILGATITPNSIVFAKKHSNGGNNNDGNNNGNDQKQKDDPNNSSTPPPDQPTNSGDQSATDQPTNSGDQPPSTDGNPPAPPPPIQPLLPVNSPASEVDCSKTPDDASCHPPKPAEPVDCIANPTEPSCQKTLPPNVDCTKTLNDPKCLPPNKEVIPNVDCNKTPDDPRCPNTTLQDSTAKLSGNEGPDKMCKYFPELEKCKPDQSGNCPNGFFTNGDGQCVPDGPCPKGFESHDDDESGTCWPKNPHQPCPPGSHRVGNHCEPNCPPGWHFIHFPSKCVKDPTCQKGFHYVNGKCVKTIVVHKTVVKHITSNSDQTSMVTRNTKITEQLTVGQAIDGCKALTKKSPDNALKKSCNIMMVAAFNYCMTHTKLWLTDSNICSDNLYLKNVQRYIAENVNLKLFPATIYNIRP
jgi:hypothetical protein